MFFIAEKNNKALVDQPFTANTRDKAQARLSWLRRDAHDLCSAVPA
jgi:hypothetical protein